MKPRWPYWHDVEILVGFLFLVALVVFVLLVLFTPV